MDGRDLPFAAIASSRAHPRSSVAEHRSALAVMHCVFGAMRPAFAAMHSCVCRDFTGVGCDTFRRLPQFQWLWLRCTQHLLRCVFVPMTTAAARLGPTRASATAFLIPGVALLLGVAVRGERVSLLSVIGCSVCVASAWLMRHAQEGSALREQRRLPPRPNADLLRTQLQLGWPVSTSVDALSFRADGLRIRASAAVRRVLRERVTAFHSTSLRWRGRGCGGGNAAQ